MNYTMNQSTLLMQKSDFMLEELITSYFSQPPFDNRKFPVFESGCEDENCKINGK